MADARTLDDAATEPTARAKVAEAEALRRDGRTGDAIDAYRAAAERFAADGLLVRAIAISRMILELDPEHVKTQAALAAHYTRRAAAKGARALAQPEPT